MSLLKNKLFIATLCLLLSGVIVWQVKKYAESSKDTATIIKLANDIEPNVEITENMIREVEVGKFNLPAELITNKNDIIGKYSAETIHRDDILLKMKFKNKADMPDQFLYELDSGSGQVAVSVSLKTLAAGMSGKLIPGDIVSVLVYKKGDFQQGSSSEGEIIEYLDLKYVEVGAINNNKAEDLGVTKKKNSKEESTSTDTIIPATVTLLVNESQAKTLAMAENTGIIHLVFRGRGMAAVDLLSNNKVETKVPNETEISQKASNIQNNAGNGQSETSTHTEDKTSDKATQQPSKNQAGTGFNIE